MTHAQTVRSPRICCQRPSRAAFQARDSVPPHPSGVIQTRMDWFYQDPIARRQPKLTGFWLAGFARVPYTPFVVLSESRDRVADALATALLLIVLTTLCFLGWRFMRTRAKGRNAGDES